MAASSLMTGYSICKAQRICFRVLFCPHSDFREGNLHLLRNDRPVTVCQQADHFLFHLVRRALTRHGFFYKALCQRLCAQKSENRIHDSACMMPAGPDHSPVDQAVSLFVGTLSLNIVKISVLPCKNSLRVLGCRNIPHQLADHIIPCCNIILGFWKIVPITLHELEQL